jgi:phospholipid-translocating ATPase
MLTGDKIETATSIAISSGLKTRKNYLFFMRELTQQNEIIAKVQELRKNVKNTTIIIDGKTLDVILNYQEAANAFFSMAIQAPCVCVCRCSPTQKAEVAK